MSTEKSNDTVNHSAAFRDTGVNVNHDFEAERIAIRTITAIVSALSLYLALCQIVLWFRGECFRCKKSENHTHASSIQFLCVFAAVMTFLRVGIPLEEMLQNENTTDCFIAFEFRVITYGLALSSLYIILWMRQRVFYWSPALSDLTSPIVRFLSFSMPVIISLGCIGTIILVNITEKSVGTRLGCAVVKNPFNRLSWIFKGVAFCIMQGILLSLLIYPLLKHRKAMRATVSNETTQIDFLIKRVLITTVICVCADTITNLVGFAYRRDLTLVHHFIYDININIDLVAVLCSFKDWREKLFPWGSISCIRESQNNGNSV
uniref:uncharacterized protein LOC120334364 n=1 Tax=Styela clava TaxID=7725 RepID=UPI001939E2F0|nr:uncharacterized protein LOC120334364 [Styela clava]